MKLIAHRGIHSSKEEQNTVKSFIKAIKDERTSGFECDIRQSKDNVFLICHNPFINNKIIKYTNYKDLKKYKLPLLKNVLKLKTSKIKLLEIKDINLNINLLNKTLNKYNKNNIYVMSFINHNINKLDSLNHNYKLGLLNYKLNNKKLYNYDFICLLNDFVNDEEINTYKRKNIEVFIYGIRNNKINKKYKDVKYILDIS